MELDHPPADVSVVGRFLARTLGAARRWETRYALRGCSALGEEVRVRGQVWVHGGGRIVLGNRVVLDGSCAPIELHALAGGEILIGDDVFIEGGTSIESVRCVLVGDRAHLGMYCKVMDSHFHALTRDRALPPTSHTVVIEPDVTLGVYSIVVAAGIERGAVVPPRSVVLHRVQAPGRRRLAPARAPSRVLGLASAPMATVAATAMAAAAPAVADGTASKGL
jgi:acetyltransferase-like isoleucine patch superfamily enzyme